MKANEIIEKIEEKYPVSFAENWDNSGFLVGDREWEVKKIFLALDVTDETLNRAIAAGADMIRNEAGNSRRFYRTTHFETHRKSHLLLCHAHEF